MMLLPDERRQHILEQLQRYGKIQVASLATALTVTQETIRRDLDELEAKQMLKRVYGGAVAYSHVKMEPRFEKKSTIEHTAKTAIGEAAATLIQDGDTIVIDVGTTTVELARAIRGVVRVTIVTNSIPAAELLNERLEAKWFDSKVIMLGGVTHPEQKSIAGALTCELLARFHFDKAFISCGGMTPSGISDYDMEKSICSNLMIQQSDQAYVLGDRSKLGKRNFSASANWTKSPPLYAMRRCRRIGHGLASMSGGLQHRSHYCHMGCFYEMSQQQCSNVTRFSRRMEAARPRPLRCSILPFRQRAPAP